MNRGKGSLITAIAVVSLLVNVVLVPISISLWMRNSELTSAVMELSNRVHELSSQVNSLIEELNLTRSQLEYYRRQVNYYASIIRGGGANQTLIGEVSINIVAVRAVRKGFFATSLEGVVLKCTIEIVEGEGRVLVNTQPKIGIDLQASARTAVLVAERVTGLSLSNSDVIVSIYADQPVEVVDGPSAGAAIAIALIAAINGEKLNETVYITGTIDVDGAIGPVGGIIEKALAAARAGGKLFIVPKGQSQVLVRVPVEYRIAPGLSIVVYEYERVNLESYLARKGYEIKVVEVDSVWDAYKYFRLK